MIHNVLLAIVTCLNCLSTDWTLIQQNYDFQSLKTLNTNLDIKYIVENNSSNIQLDQRFLIMEEDKQNHNLYHYVLENNYDGLIKINSKTWLNTSQLMLWLDKNKDVESASLHNNNDNDIKDGLYLSKDVIENILDNGLYLSKNVIENILDNEDLSLNNYDVEDQINVDFKLNFTPDKIPVVVFAHKRAKSLQNLITTIKIADPNRKVYVSEDSEDQNVIDVINKNNLVRISQKHNLKGYSAISQHFYLTFEELLVKYEKVIVLEEDLLVSPDFFHYMDYFETLLDIDQTLMCVSAWSDNGFEGRVKDPTRVYRTHFFPGLGWILTRKYWETIKSKWLGSSWDDLIRDHEFKYGGKQCLFPEISRTEHTFDEIGTSGGEANEYISKVKRNSIRILWGWIHNNKLNYQEYTNWIKNEMNKGKIIMGNNDSVLKEYGLMPGENNKYKTSFVFNDNSILTPIFYENIYVYIVINSEVSCYYINMKKSVDRHEYMKNHIKDVRLPLFINLCQRSDGIEYYKKETSSSLMKNGQLGVWKAHQEVWSKTKTKWTLIMEDDIIIDVNCDFSLPENQYNLYHLDVKSTNKGLDEWRCGAYGYMIENQLAKKYSIIDPETLGDVPVDHYILNVIHNLQKNIENPNSIVKYHNERCIKFDDNLFKSLRLKIDS
jgi:alpha-1,3-mannosyl-glycoprotein beta-1,2-N-acetylglucosaminyltransferase